MQAEGHVLAYAKSQVPGKYGELLTKKDCRIERLFLWSVNVLKREHNRHGFIYHKLNMNCENEMASLAPLRDSHLLHSKGRQRETSGAGSKRDRALRP